MCSSDLALGNPRRAIQFYEQQLIIAREIGNLQGEALGSWNLGLAYEKAGEFDKAITALEVCVNFERSIGHPDTEKYAAKVNLLRTQLKGAAPAQPLQTNPAQAAFEAFQHAVSSQSMQVAVGQHPMLKDKQFILAIEELIAKQVPQEHKPAFEQRLAVLKQIAGK